MLTDLFPPELVDKNEFTMLELIKDFGLIAGIGGIGIGVFLYLFKDIISNKFLSRLSSKQSFLIILFFMFFVWSISALAIYVYWNKEEISKIDPDPDPKDSLPDNKPDNLPDIILSKGDRLTIKGTFNYDLDLGIQDSDNDVDFWWEQVTEKERYLTPRYNAAFKVLGDRGLDDINLKFLKALNYSKSKIRANNDNSNQLTPGTVVAYKTGKGNFGVMKVISYGYNMKIKWKTFQTPTS